MNTMILKTKSNEVDEKGVVTIAVSAFGNVDYQGDIVEKGAYTKSLKENFNRIKHLLNHDEDKLIGCPVKGWEDNKHLVMVSELNLDTQLGRDVYSFYKQYQKNGMTLEHSIMANAVKRDTTDKRIIKELKLWEFSTLYGWGANERTPLLELKKLDFDRNPQKAIDFLRDSLKVKTFSDEVLAQYEEYLSLIEKAVGGKAQLVECPHCKLKFAYDSVEEHTISSEMKELIRNYYEWKMRDIVAEEMEKLSPEIRSEVQAMIANDKIGKSMNIEDELAYVHCPNCYRRIYRSEIIETKGQESKSISKPSDDTSAKSRQDGTFGIDTLAGLFAVVK